MKYIIRKNRRMILNQKKIIFILFLVAIFVFSYSISFVKLSQINKDKEINPYKTDNKILEKLKDSSDISSPLLWYSQTGFEVQAVAISSNGNYIISGSKSLNKDLIAFYHKNDSIPLWVKDDLNGEVVSVDISSNGSYMVAGTGFGYGRDTKVYLFEKDSSTPLWSYQAGDIVFSVAISSGGNYIVAGSKDDRVYLFHKSSSTPIWSYQAGDHISSVAISSDGKYIVAGSGDHKMYFFERSSSTPLWSHTINYIPGYKGDVKSVSISSDGNYIAAGTQVYQGTSKVYLFNRTSSTPLWSYSVEDYINSVSIDSSGKSIIAGTEDNKLFFFNRSISSPLWNYTTEDSVISVSISADGNYIVAGGSWDDKTIYFFSRYNSEPLWKYKTTNKINSVDISFNGSIIVGGVRDNNVYLFKSEGTQKHITLFTDAENPDTNSDFKLYWNTFFTPDYIWIYEYNRYITDINDTINLVDSGYTLNNPYRITGLSNGTHYYKLKMQNNIYGEIYSKCIKVNIYLIYNLLWSRLYGGDNIQGGQDLAIDSFGNVYQTGYIMDGPHGRNDGIIIKSSNSGIQIWNYTFGTSNNDIGIDVCIDSKNNVYIAGTVDQHPVDHQDKIIILKYNSLGQYLWNRTWSEMSRANARSIAVDSEDNIYVAGYAGDIAPTDLVFIKYNSSGVKIWQRIWGGDDYEGRYGLSIAIDSQDHLFVAAQTNSFGAGDADAVIIKYDKFGNQLWNKTWGGVSIDGADAITIDSDDNIFIAGYTVSFSTNGNRNIFVAKFNNSGTQIWNKTWFGIESANCKDMIVDSNDYIFLTGYTYDSMHEFVFLLMYDGEGNFLWNTTWGDELAMMCEGFGIAVDSFGNIYISGYVDYYEGHRDDIFLLKYSQLLTPDPFVLYSDAGNPDIDGIFNLYWFKSDRVNNYSLYVYNRYITRINSSLTLLAFQTAISPFEINTINGTYFYIATAHNQFGNTLSNCIKVVVTTLPETFILSSNADNPDLDGIFDLIWTSSSEANNYSIYVYDKFITEINTSLTLIAYQTAVSPYEINTTNGTYYYIVVAHNNYGNLLSNCIEIFVQLDNKALKLIINSPTINDLFGVNAPSYDITVLEGNLDTVWYQLNDGIKITEIKIIDFLYGSIEQNLWDQMGNGTLIIQFFANDTLGNLGHAEVLIRKDIEAPEISILEPSTNDIFAFSPAYEITIIEGNLDLIWYTLNGGENNYTVTELLGIIDQEHWNSLPNGYITLRFYAIDSLGNINYDEVIIVKTTPSGPPAILGYNLYILFSVVCIISVIIIKFRINKSSK